MRAFGYNYRRGNNGIALSQYSYDLAIYLRALFAGEQQDWKIKFLDVSTTDISPFTLVSSAPNVIDNDLFHCWRDFFPRYLGRYRNPATPEQPSHSSPI